MEGTPFKSSIIVFANFFHCTIGTLCSWLLYLPNQHSGSRPVPYSLFKAQFCSAVPVHSIWSHMKRKSFSRILIVHSAFLNFLYSFPKNGINLSIYILFLIRPFLIAQYEVYITGSLWLQLRSSGGQAPSLSSSSGLGHRPWLLCSIGCSAHYATIRVFGVP